MEPAVTYLRDLIFAAKLVLFVFAGGALLGTFLLGCRAVLGWPR